MRKEIIAQGKDVETAYANALAALGVDSLDDISHELIDLGSRGIFGIGARPAKVRAWIDLPDTVAPPQHGTAKPEARVKESAEGNAPAAPAQKQGERRNKGNRRRNRGGRRSDGVTLRDFTAPDEPSKPKEKVIPEAELKMERVDVQAGDDLAYDFVKQLVENLGIDAEVALFHCEDNSRRIAITGEGASVLIGHHGEALDSLQYLANLAGTRKNADGERNRRRVTIDVEGYRAKREETLRALARKMAAKALRTHKNVMLEPMSAYERRIIHSEIQGIEGVATNSIGSDNNRKIVIYLTDKKVEKKDEQIAPDTTAEGVSASDTTDDATV